jgi:hypothetical protein
MLASGEGLCDNAPSKHKRQRMGLLLFRCDFFPKGSCIGSLVPSVVMLRGGGTIKEMGPSGKLVGSLRALPLGGL